MTKIATHGYVRAEIGTFAESLSWGIFASQVLAGLGLTLAVLAKGMLSREAQPTPRLIGFV